MREIRSPIFRSRKATNGGCLHRISVTHLVKEAAKRTESGSAHPLVESNLGLCVSCVSPVHTADSMYMWYSKFSTSAEKMKAYSI
ncbi:hypothetical protein QUB63_17945 [Microcoleus sp. ARI1-B5]|uniref:hypothetical protein n=1 Tax=unclassified Microcoleus TaxID=2642155 RepID=UPI002FD38311